MSSVYREPLRSGSCVTFRLGDAICPGFGQIASQVGPDVKVCGEVAFFSDRGREKGHFAIIKVDGLPTPLIVPVSRIDPFLADAPERTMDAEDCDASDVRLGDGMVPNESRRLGRPGEQREAG